METGTTWGHPCGFSFPNDVCCALLHESRHSIDKWSHMDYFRLYASLRMSLSECRDWNLRLESRGRDELPLLGHPCVAHSFHPPLKGIRPRMKSIPLMK